MATPAAWNRREGEPLGGEPEALGGGVAQERTGRFVVLSDAPSGDPASDQGAPPPGPAPPPAVSDAIGNPTGGNPAGSVPADTEGHEEGATFGEGVPGGGIGGSSPGPPGTGGTPGTTAGDSSTEGGQARGGLITGSEAEHPITAQKGEYIVRERAVEQYGVPFMNAVNRGELLVLDHGKYMSLHRGKPAPKSVMGKARPQHTLMRGA